MVCGRSQRGRTLSLWHTRSHAAIAIAHGGDSWDEMQGGREGGWGWGGGRAVR
jgi:hypothetical protein